MIDELTTVLEGPPMWQAILLVLGISGVSAIVFEIIDVELAKRFVARTERRFDDILFEELRIPIVVMLFLAGTYILTQLPAAAAAVGGEATRIRFSAFPRFRSSSS